MQANLRGGQSGWFMSIQIADRRWKWQFGQITGAYNLRTLGTDDVEAIDAATEKTPWELAKLLLDAMGEQDSNALAIISDARPLVLWDHANPAQELQALCESLGCSIVLGLDNRVRIVRLGVGLTLPQVPSLRNPGFGLARRPRPEKIKVVGGPVLYQSSLRLQAVGLETNGSVKVLDDLSYLPAVGYFPDPQSGFPGITATYRDAADGLTRKSRLLAEASVYRWYRIKEQAHNPGSDDLRPPDYPGEPLNRIQQIILTDQLVERQTLLATGEAPDARNPPALTKLVPRPAYVEGEFVVFPDGPMGKQATMDGRTVSYPFRVNTTWQLDAQRCMAVFSSPLFRPGSTTASGANGTREAEIYLTCAYSLVTTETLMPDRYNIERAVPDGIPGSGTRIIFRPEIQLKERTIYGTDFSVQRVESNIVQCDEEANHYIDAALREYEANTTGIGEYVGLEKIEPDGTILQVTWRIDGSGTFTQAGYNQEANPYSPSYREKRRLQEITKYKQMSEKLGPQPGSIQDIYRQAGGLV